MWAWRPVWGWVAVAVVVLVVGLGGPVVLRERASARYPVTADDLAAGRAELAALVVTEQIGEAPYDRDRFGTAWADVDANGCDTRNDVLRRDLSATTVDVDACTVLTGVLDDPYTGRRIAFTRGAHSADVQIDHVVALADAWSSGAAGWDARTREAFANDPANLLAVDGDANQDKGAADAAQWLPPDPGYTCVYALRQIRVKHAYGLGVTSDERRALAAALGTCAVV